MKTDFHKKKFALSLAFIMKFKATRNWLKCRMFHVNRNSRICFIMSTSSFSTSIGKRAYGCFEKYKEQQTFLTLVQLMIYVVSNLLATKA